MSKYKSVFKYNVTAKSQLGKVSIPVRNKKEAQETMNRWKKQTSISLHNAGYKAYYDMKVVRRKSKLFNS